MIPEGKELYTSLEKELAAFASEGLSIAVTERCFLKANQYWDNLKAQLKDFLFESEEAEIYFFKNIKPLFTSTIEYYGLLAHAQLFIESVQDKAELQQFFCRELMRLDKCAAANQDFFDYYVAGATHMDLQWFVRANNDGGNFLHAKPYDLDSTAATRYDYLISRFLAVKKYADYLRKERATMLSGV